MTTFEELQNIKISTAVHMLAGLSENLERMRDYQRRGEHKIVEEWLLKVAAALAELKDRIEKQMLLCPEGGNCMSLLSVEKIELQKVIENLKLAAKGVVELNDEAWRGVLILISSKHSLADLLKTDRRLAA